MPRIEAVGTALPPHVVTQAEARAACEKAYAGHPHLLALLRVFDRCGVEKRHFAFPPEYYLSEKSFEKRNADYVEQAVILAETAAHDCLSRTNVDAAEIDHILIVTTTGLATPSLDALLAPRIGLRPGTRRWPLFGLGCAGGAGALIRAADILRGQPKQRALVIAVELCGQVFSSRAKNRVDLVGAALFADGAAAVLVAGDDVAGSGPRICDTRTSLFPDSSQIMGWDFTSDGMRLRLSEEVADLVKRRLPPVVENFLASNGLALADLNRWILHPGGRRIIEAYREAFGCGDESLDLTRQSLAREGNISSASVLFILGDLLERDQPDDGGIGLLVALGPGFSAEMLLLKW